MVVRWVLNVNIKYGDSSMPTDTFCVYRIIIIINTLKKQL